MRGYKAQPHTGSWRHQVNRNRRKVSLILIVSVLAANQWCRITSVMPAPLPEPERKEMQFCSHLPHLGRAQKDQTEQNRGLERIISQTQGLLLGLDTVCLVTIYLCNRQSQRILFIKGPTLGFFGMLNTSADYKGLRSVQKIKD